MPSSLSFHSPALQLTDLASRQTLNPSPNPIMSLPTNHNDPQDIEMFGICQTNRNFLINKLLVDLISETMNMCQGVFALVWVN
jgi:hypothetical protein